MKFLAEQLNVNQRYRVIMKDEHILGCDSEFFLLDDFLGKIGLFLYEYDKNRYEHILEPDYDDEPVAIYEIISAKQSAFNEMHLIIHLTRVA